MLMLNVVVVRTIQETGATGLLEVQSFLWAWDKARSKIEGRRANWMNIKYGKDGDKKGSDNSRQLGGAIAAAIREGFNCIPPRVLKSVTRGAAEVQEESETRALSGESISGSLSLMATVEKQRLCASLQLQFLVKRARKEEGNVGTLHTKTQARRCGSTQRSKMARNGNRVSGDGTWRG